MYSTNTPLRDRQPDRPLHQMVEAMGMESHHEDGNLVENVCELSKSVIARMRKDQLPRFLEFATYRTREHCGPNEDPEGYRPASEKAYWKTKDPLRKATGKEFNAMRSEIAKEIDQAFRFAKRSPFSTYSSMNKLIYAP